ncbi:MAG: hypothetical protein K9M07_02005 [Simkaniaceae bacterium]|nr:hypothetical protein [Simkaniaceae bacterium]
MAFIILGLAITSSLGVFTYFYKTQLRSCLLTEIELLSDRLFTELLSEHLTATALKSVIETQGSPIIALPTQTISLEDHIKCTIHPSYQIVFDAKKIKSVKNSKSKAAHIDVCLIFNAHPFKTPKIMTYPMILYLDPPPDTI